MKNFTDLQENWDLIIIGGGITGAGILRESIRMGLRVLLVEEKDFAWGTSSRSSKLVHGGLRYLKEGKFLLTKAAVEEREHLLNDAPGLVESLAFLVPVYKGHSPGKWALETGLSIYDLIAQKRQHTYFEADAFIDIAPHIEQKGLMGGFRFFDAQVDDARLVLRLINESVALGALALNYTRATEIKRNEKGEVVGAVIEDTETQDKKTLIAKAVINATGVWAERLHPSPKAKLHLRPLRGSHLVFPSNVIPIKQAVSFVHPVDKRPLFVIPWENVIIVGTTDLDHKEDISYEPYMSAEEGLYMMEALRSLFPSLKISLNDCLSSYAGIRPVLSKGKLEPSEESREHVVWVSKGLVTITGGKLTTFRRLAHDALKAAKPFLPPVQFPEPDEAIFSKVPSDPSNADYGLSKEMWRRLYGRYGTSALELVKAAQPEDLDLIPGTLTLWAEIPFTAQHERVRHLDDLLLRRVRVGLLTRKGGKAHLKRIKKMCMPILQWSRKQWKTEIKNYLDLWNRAYALPSEISEKPAIHPSRWFEKLIKPKYKLKKIQ
ncbi:MAG: glycerol-3-phosphate dehydrogenase/oxidase [Desulfobacterales bacterium]|nr:glycerol-3-phosphate dehydrogenase/oxidase [Desulfobacterales bacterium]